MNGHFDRTTNLSRNNFRVIDHLSFPKHPNHEPILTLIRRRMAESDLTGYQFCGWTNVRFGPEADIRSRGNFRLASSKKAIGMYWDRIFELVGLPH
jgi:hypothetical protein